MRSYVAAKRQATRWLRGGLVVDDLVGWIRFMGWIEFRSRDDPIPDDLRHAFHKAEEFDKKYQPQPDERMTLRLGGVEL